MINTLFLFLALPYIYWSLIIGLGSWSYYLAHDEDDFHWGAGILVALMVAALSWQFPIVFTTLTSWPEAAYALGGYVVVGVLVAAYKWYGILVDFKERAPQWMETVKVDSRTDKHVRLSSLIYGCYGKVSMTGITQDSPPRYYPNWKGFPISNWITFWPLFSLSIAFDALGRVAKRLVNSIGAALERVAKKFSVS